MAEMLPFRRARHWTGASHHGVAKPRRAGWAEAARETGPILWAAPLVLGVAVFLATSPEMRAVGPALPSPVAQTAAGSGDRERASFAKCGPFASRQACVIDGDTFWYRGTKIRVADINTPETSDPKCAAEAELGARATRRFAELMSAGAFTLDPIDRSHDKYGRALFVVTRGGESVGGVLVAEGLAEEWQGYRREWC